MARGAISWLCKKQPTVALSTTESEYMALSAAAQEAIWLTQLQAEIVDRVGTDVTIFCDNKSAINLTEKGTYSARTKHISIKHHFVRELVSSGKLKIQHINTLEMVADILTKALPISKHTFCAMKMGLVNAN